MHEPDVARMQVVLVDGVVRPFGHLLMVLLQRAPEVRHEAVEIVDRLVSVEWLGTPEKNSAAPKERLHVVRDRTEARPYLGGHLSFAAEPREGRIDRHFPPSAS